VAAVRATRKSCRAEEVFVKSWGVPSIFIGRFFSGRCGPSVPLAAGIFEMAVLALFRSPISYPRWSGRRRSCCLANVIAQIVEWLWRTV